MLAQLRQLHPNDIRIVYRDFPLLGLHDKASLATQAAAAAGSQGHFWEMHDALFNRFDEWANLTPDQFKPWVVNVASELGLDATQVAADLDSRRFEPYVADAYNQAVASGIPGTPFIFLNRDLFRLPLTLENLEAAVRLTLLTDRQSPAYPEFQLQPGADYRARIRLNIGEVVIDLFEDTAPLAVNSFVYLAQSGWFDGNPIERVVPGELVETGDPTGTGFGGPGYAFEVEANPARKFDRAGMVGVTNSGSASNGSQFFIALKALPELDGTRTVLGMVTSGLELLQSLDARDPMTDLMSEPQARILSVRIEKQ